MSRLTLWAWPCGLAAKKLLRTSMDLDLIATVLQTMYNAIHLCYYYHLFMYLLFSSMDSGLIAAVLQTMYGHIFISYDWFYINYLLLNITFFFFFIFNDIMGMIETLYNHTHQNQNKNSTWQYIKIIYPCPCSFFWRVLKLFDNWCESVQLTFG